MVPFSRYLQHVKVKDAGTANVVLSLIDPLQAQANVLCLQVLVNTLPSRSEWLLKALL